MLKLFYFFFLNSVSASSDGVNFACAPGETGCDVPAHDPVVKCGTFIKYNPKNFRTLPEIKGFSGGVSFDGSIQYVGFGNSDCSVPAEKPCPAVIQTSKPAGAYMPCDDYYFGYKIFDDQNAFFLQNHSDLKWIRTDEFKMLKVPDTILIPGPWYKYFIGRVKYEGQYRMGKVHINKVDWLGLYILDGNETIAYFDEGFEVLTCPRCKNGGKGRYCCTNNADNPDCCENGGYGPKCTWRCGQQLLLTQFDPNNPQTAGFPTGTFHDGSTVFVGTGFYKRLSETRPSRITTERSGPAALKGPGAYYYIYYSSYTDNQTATYFVDHAKLEWVRIKRSDGPPYDAIKNYPNYGFSNEFEFYARMNLTRGGVRYQDIGHYFKSRDYEGNWGICYRNGNQAAFCEYTEEIEFDILVCRQTYNL